MKFRFLLGKKSQSNATKLNCKNWTIFNTLVSIIQILAGFVPTNQRNSKVGNTVSLILYWSFIQTISLSFIFWERKYLVEKFQKPFDKITRRVLPNPCFRFLLIVEEGEECDCGTVLQCIAARSCCGPPTGSKNKSPCRYLKHEGCLEK